MRQTIVRWRYHCDEDGCMVSTISSDDTPPAGWTQVGELHFCHNHYEDAEERRALGEREDRSDG